MKIEIYQSNKSVRPFTSWTSVADMLNYLAENGNIATICQKIAETGDKSLKDKLPAMMPMGHVGDLTRKKENCEPTGLVMIDIDNKTLSYPPVEGEESHAAWMEGVKKHFEERQSELERNHVVLIHITPSGKGLRLLVHCHAEGMEATIENCTRAFDLERFGKVDPACKDLSRLSYLVPEDYILYEKGLFDEAPAISIEQMRKYKVTGTVAKGENVQKTLFDVQESDEEYADFPFNGTPVRQIVQEYIEANGGEPQPATRHNAYNELVVLFRNICDNNPKIVHAVLPKFGHSDEETWKQATGLCESNKSTHIPYKLFSFLRKRGYWVPSEKKEEVEAEETPREGMPPIPALPPVFRQYVNAAPNDFKIPTVIALLPILGTLTSHLRAEYFDGSEQSTSFLSLVYAPPSSGKRFIQKLSKLLDNLRQRDILSNAREEIYAAAERKKSANEKGQDNPHVSVRIVKPIISIPELLWKMRDNKGHHMYIEAEELDTFRKANKTTGGDKSDMWRVAWDNDKYGQYFKSVHTFKGEVKLYLNMLFTSTPDQVAKCFPNVEDGLVTRFSFCEIENQKYAKFTAWKKITKADQLKIQNILDRLEMLNYKMPLKFNPDDLADVKDSEFDAVVPWQPEWQPFQHVDMGFMFKPLLNWLEVQRERAQKEMNDARDVFRRRAAVKAFRLALLCTALYKTVGTREKKVITDFALWLAEVDLRNSLTAFGDAYNKLSGDRPKQNCRPVTGKSLFDDLPDRFTRGELYVKATQCGLTTPVRNILYQWKQAGLIVKRNAQEYQKARKGK